MELLWGRGMRKGEKTLEQDASPHGHLDRDASGPWSGTRQLKRGVVRGNDGKELRPVGGSSDAAEGPYQ